MGTVDANNPVNPVQGPITNVNTSPEQLQQLLQYYQEGSGVSSLQSIVTLLEQLESSAPSSPSSSSAADIMIAPTESKIVGGLMELVQNLQNYTTANSAQVPPSLVSQLQSMATGLQQTPPQLPSDSQLNSLSSDLSSLNTLVKGTNPATQGPNFPPQAQSQYWGQQASVFQGIGSSLTALLSSSTIQQVYEQLSTQTHIYSQVPSGTTDGISPNQLAGNVMQILSILPQLGTIDPASQNTILQQLQPLFQNVQFNAYSDNTSSGAVNYSFSQVAAYSQISEWASSYLQSNPGTTASQLQTYLQQQSQSLFSSLPSNSPLLSDLQSNINSDLAGSNYTQTITTFLQLPTSSSGVLTPAASTNQDSVAAMIQNLGLVQISQPTTPPPSEQVASAQNIIAYINDQLQPCYNSNTPPPSTLSPTVLANILTALPDLARVAAGSDPTASAMAMQYLENTKLESSQNMMTGTVQVTLMQLAAYKDLAVTARAYASQFSSSSPPTVAGLQAALQSHVASLSTKYTPSAMIAFENQQVNDNPLPNYFDEQGPGQEIPPGVQYTPPPPPYQVPNSLSGPPFAIYQFPTTPIPGMPGAYTMAEPTASSPITIPSNDEGLASPSMNTLTTSTQQGAFAPVPGLQPPAPMTQTVNSAMIQALNTHQSAIQSVIQQANSAQIASQVQQALIDNKGGQSLQDAFAAVILQHYMPGQESLLQSQATQLNYTNWLGEKYTSLVSSTSDFSSANTVLRFGQMLAQPTGWFAYSGSLSAAQSALTTEQSYIGDNLTNVNSAITQTQALLNDLNTGSGGAAPFLSNPQLQTQITNLKATLQTQLGNLTQTQGQLQNLQGIISSISLSAGGTANTFIALSTSPDFLNLTNQESVLVNGGSGISSMSQVAQDISTQSQQTTSQSQTQQMSLQLSMTEIQQEWSVVSAGLQILNQVYLSFAQGISQT